MEGSTRCCPDALLLGQGLPARQQLVGAEAHLPVGQLLQHRLRHQRVCASHRLDGSPATLPEEPVLGRAAGHGRRRELPLLGQVQGPHDPHPHELQHRA
eukprot:8640738-Alexandrium_andersonii.AAC.1